MNRRKAIGRIFLTGVGGALAVSGYKWYDWHKTPDYGFAEEHAALIAALAETIIPATDTPGAKEAGVPEFIMAMLRDCTPITWKNRFIDGLKELQAYSKNKYGNVYEQCTEEQQHTVLKHFEEKGKPLSGLMGKVQERLLGRSFFTTLKHYTVEGYGTSQLGATRGLAYLPVPGSFHGCIPLQPGQRAWATK